MSQPATHTERRRRMVALAALGVLAVVVLGASLVVGSSDVRIHDVLEVVAGGGPPQARSVLLDIRVPRMLAAFGVGSLLALAGVLLQALFRNALADPYVLGVSGGAAVAALMAMLAGAAMPGVQASAVAGAFGAVVLVYLLGRGEGTSKLLLTGVVLASACGALVSILLAVADSSRVRGMVFWLAGDLGWAPGPLPSVLAGLFAVVAAIVLARPLNVMASGEARARSVGLDFDFWRLIVFLACAGVTAVAVVSAGTVGFVGLIVPHAVRLLFRTADHRIVAPTAALLGGTLLAAADLAARTLVSPRQLPVGAVMALVGTPLFIALLRGAARR